MLCLLGIINTLLKIPNETVSPKIFISFSRIRCILFLQVNFRCSDAGLPFIIPSADRSFSASLQTVQTSSCNESVTVKGKVIRYRPDVAQRVGRGIALLFHDRGTRRG